MRLLDAVLTYPYALWELRLGNLYEPYEMDMHAHTKTNLVKMPNLKCRSIEMDRLLFVVKQSCRIWHRLVSNFLSKMCYGNTATCPCLCINQSPEGLAILVVQVDNINVVGTHKEEVCKN